MPSKLGAAALAGTATYCASSALNAFVAPQASQHAQVTSQSVQSQQQGQAAAGPSPAHVGA
eukprot:CAMPEP_0204143028 /NCGR_PEP_ID=MMETSP0361-20130328/20294_1 /ASSEMBLY_ACC=CAM_ASM_000343 /TAXON_ID=268821 /ORGANISM="Scrippsiella Hangoei, Strain SHTV-5" /LENGTH=60 /DNA_ID=CAMNT_0051096877 /DNA_START=61 /DNA_END=240 /DNA_ORIENTATION=+